jgi:hypothetical protein
MRLFKRWLFAIVLAAGAASALAAQPPFPIPQPIPAPVPRPSPVDGRWFFRGDPSKPCYIQTVSTPSGPQLLLTNENGTQAYGSLSRSGRQVTIPDWNLIGTVRGDALVWPNGDFWHR